MDRRSRVSRIPQFADTATALLGIVAVVAVYSGAILPVSGHRKRGFVVPTMLIGLLAVWTLTAAGTSTHSGGHDDTAVGGGHEVAKADATERVIAATEVTMTATHLPQTRRPP